jgi:hypothetical protein
MINKPSDKFSTLTDIHIPKNETGQYIDRIAYQIGLIFEREITYIDNCRRITFYKRFKKNKIFSAFKIIPFANI